MPRLPDVQVLGERDPRASYQVPSMPRNPLPGAIEGLGAAIAGAGDTIMRQRKVDARIAKAEAKEAAAEVERAQRFANTGRLLEFEKQERDYLTKASENVSPGAADFTKGYMTGFDERARKFFGPVVDGLKPETDLQLYKLRTNLEEAAKKYEREEGRRYYGNRVNDGLTVLLDQQRQSVDSWADVQLRGERYIDDLSPELFSAAEKDEMKRQWKERRVISWTKDHPEEAQQALARAAPAGGGDVPIVVANQPGRVSKGSTEGLNPTLLNRFKATQNAFGKSVPIVSGFRDEKTNAEAGGAKKSQHLYGNAIDIDVSNLSPAERRQLIELASANGITGIGVGKNSLHFDVGARRAWGYPTIPPWAVSAIDRHKLGKARAPTRSGTDPRARQLDFVVHELGTTERKADALLRGATTIEQAVDANLAYERPSIPARENRIKYGNAVLAGKAPKEAIAARDYLVSKGYTPVQASGFVGGLMQESGLNLNAGIAGDAGASVGIAQWNGDRRAAMEAFTGGTSSGYASIPPEFQGVPYETIQTVMTGIEAAQQKERLAASALVVNQLDLGIETGAVTSPAQILDADIDAGAKAKLLRRFNDRQESGVAAIDVWAAINAGLYIDSTDSKAMKGLNAIFNSAGGAQALIDGDEKAVTTTLFMWEKSNVVADDAKQAMLAMTRSPDDATLIRGLTYLEQMQARNPAAFDATFDDKTARLLQRYNTVRTYGGPETVAAEMRERADPEWIKTRKPLYDEGMKHAEETFDVATVVAMYDGYVFSAEGPRVAGDAGAMAQDFRELYADSYAETGDEEQAKANAFRLLQRVWSPSVLNGGAITRFAPEKFYPAVGGSHDWMKDLLETDLREAGYTQETMSAGRGKAVKSKKVRDYAITPAPQLTEAQISGKVPPQWNIIVRNDRGEYELVTDPVTKKVLLWPGRGDLARIAKEKAQDFHAEVGKDRELRQDFNAIDEQMRKELEGTAGPQPFPMEGLQ